MVDNDNAYHYIDDDDDDLSHDSAWDAFDSFIGRSNLNAHNEADSNREEGFDYFFDFNRRMIANDLEDMIMHADSGLDDDDGVDTEAGASAETSENASTFSTKKNKKPKEKKGIKASRIMEQMHNRRKNDNSERPPGNTSSLDKTGESSVGQKQLSYNNNTMKELRKALEYDEKTERLVYVEKYNGAKFVYNQKLIQNEKEEQKKMKKPSTKHKINNDDLQDVDQSFDRVTKFLRRFQQDKIFLLRANGRFV